LKSQKTEQLTAERWQQAKAIVGDALEEKSSTARAALVADRCGRDAELLREVESLLEQTTGSLETFAQNAPESVRREISTLAPGLRLGAYAIVRELGRGGMGAVYLAQRADGVFEKQVAIKILKRGTDTDEILRRFNAERQILARLDHPNIARLLDGGTSDDGLPYFVMEYVDGVPITQFAREHELSVAERLKLFRVVCGAVSYAHQNLVIHRDIKPSNVLVTKEGEVRLLDFGIAKLLQEADSEQQSVTITIQRVMTPEYASPEQVKGEAVTTVSDVYSLGVFLYELLTNERPYKLKRRSADEISKAICEQEPERPSTAITRDIERTDGAEKIRRQLRGDLDNIVLKALRKEPQRRYTSVDQFSEDIRRRLEGLPVRARKVTSAYRASKFIQRHKLGVSAAMLVALALIAGSITTAWEAHQARLEKAKAERRFNEVRKLAHALMFDYHDEIASLPGSTKVRQRLVNDSLKYLDSLAHEASNDRSLLREIGSAYQRIGEIQGVNMISRSGGTLTFSNLGDTQGALESLRKALGVRERLAKLEPSNRDIQEDYATNIVRLGELSVTLGKPREAIDYYRSALPIAEKLLAADASSKSMRTKFYSVYFAIGRVMGVPTIPNLGDTRDALENLQKAIDGNEALAAENPATPTFRQVLGADYSNIAQVQAADGNQAESLASNRKALALDEDLVKENPVNTLYRRQLAVQYGNIGDALIASNDLKEALEYCRKAVVIWEALVATDPADAYVHRDSAVGYCVLATSLAKNDDPAGARANFEKALQIFQELSAKDPMNAFVSYQQAQTCLKFSTFLSNIGDIPGSIEKALEAVRIGEALVAIGPDNNGASTILALSYLQLGKYSAMLASKPGTFVIQQEERWHEAKNWYHKSFDIWRNLKSKGTLSRVEVDKPDEVARDIANCDAALR